eukprot:CAMPEP_0184855834 /NCGR_PEP_ID=MMETSP0580-20130426/973_1 /TAXON_ID=1118495 /ORGANISM="Dactyliosolen fragilissimus" /LENGTH=1326 /DNA_ID=CAMNT_0027350471 /DNA_START=326 /DNA_END=4306 /DNA_ORIENTATION=-
MVIYYQMARCPRLSQMMARPRKKTSMCNISSMKYGAIGPGDGTTVSKDLNSTHLVELSCKQTKSEESSKDVINIDDGKKVDSQTFVKKNDRSSDMNHFTNAAESMKNKNQNNFTCHDSQSSNNQYLSNVKNNMSYSLVPTTQREFTDRRDTRNFNGDINLEGKDVDNTTKNTSSLQNFPMACTSNVAETSIGADLKENHQDGIYSNETQMLNTMTEKIPECDPEFASQVNLDPISTYKPFPKLNVREVAELELSLQIGDKFDHSDDNTWRDDWNGNLQLIDKDLVVNRAQLAQNPQSKKITLTFCQWVAEQARHSDDFRGIQLLFSYVYHMEGTPPMAKKIMAHYFQRNAKSISERLQFILEAIRRISYDPTVLIQDGWTTAKSESPDGENGGAYLIGRRVIWHRYEGIIIAYVRDEEIGDLWKAMWFEDSDTFDLEADELQDALKKWDRKQGAKKRKNHANIGFKPVYDGKSKVQKQKTSTSIRFEASRNFTVEGAEEGIILATSYNARVGIPWPARIMHVNEIKSMGSQQSQKRSSSKSEISVIFLAPFWNGSQYSQNSKSKISYLTSSNDHAKNIYSTGPLFEVETLDVSEDTIHKYPYTNEGVSLSIDKLRTEFQFLGLPKAAFSRYLDSHRLALALKTYAQKQQGKIKHSIADDTSQVGAVASLTDTHPLSVLTYQFPLALLNLPFEYILSNLPSPDDKASQLIGVDGEEIFDPIIQLDAILQCLKPPLCFGWTKNETIHGDEPIGSKQLQDETSIFDCSKLGTSTPLLPSPMDSSVSNKIPLSSKYDVCYFASEFLLKNIGCLPDCESTMPLLDGLGIKLLDLVNQFKYLLRFKNSSKITFSEELMSFLSCVLLAKGHGEENLSTNNYSSQNDNNALIFEWRKACESIYKTAIFELSNLGDNDGITAVITDSRCNQHLTASGSFERAVRLPAAIRGAKAAGAGSLKIIRLINEVDDKYMELAEVCVLPRAHKASYLKRMKDKISALPSDAKGVPLTDDSEGEGGEDTMGSRGSYTAAVVGVAAALKGIDMITSGKCLNAFCAVRPPGHHAGKELRPMNAISNGFCILNAAACAALYAVAPKSERGLGLKRVCVIDFDVHHGNGTQDILCSTHDSRFLYISTHAGGTHINGFDDHESNEGFHRGLNTGKNEGIFPGRCGDSSPHKGVLNIPLGQKVTPQAIGTAFVSIVSPAVEEFSPDLIILSAGFDAHKNDPLGMGGLSASDFGTVTAVTCHLARKICSGRVISILEGGYGVPCCRPLKEDIFLPGNVQTLLDLKDDLPIGMEDNVDIILRQKLDKCHQEGFLECVKEHVTALAKCKNI